jgi:NAD(P)-dependent dehydrogenase (short-subunit alcohol dehydrogenase family)
MNYEGKRMVVTGGSRGIGFEICKIFLEEGALVLAVSRDPLKLERARDLLPGLSIFTGDVSRLGDIDHLANFINDSWNPLDILVNNAGIHEPSGPVLLQQQDAVFHEIMNVNVTAPYLITKRLLPYIRRGRDPRIINIGSCSGLINARLRGAYGVSKAALHALTVAMASELAQQVAVNAICPGWVRTDMAPDGPGDPRTSAENVLWLANLPIDFTGQVICDRQSVL